MIFTHEITLDITFNEIKIINIKQYTKDSFLLHVNLTDRGEPFCADKNNLVCQFKMKTPDGKCILTDGIIKDDGSVDISIPEKACLTAGSGTAEVIFVTSEIVSKANSASTDTNELLDSSAAGSIDDSIASYGTHSQSGTVFATMNLSVNIVASSYNNDSITSSDDFDALHSALLAANKTYDRVMTSASTSASEAKIHEDNAADFAHAAETSANAADTSASAAETSANSARSSALLAQSYAVGGSGLSERKNENEDCAKHYCEQASNESQKSSDSALLSKSYAVGGTGLKRPDNTKTEAEDNAEYYCKRAEFYYQQAQAAKKSLEGALRPMRTISFEELLTLTGVQPGDMYNISNQFTTTDQFREGAGLTIPQGANVYKTATGEWDVLAGSPVTGVKGNSETSYRKGNVNITKANIGLGNVDNTADKDKSVRYATSAGSAANATNATNAIKATQDSDGNVIKDSYVVRKTVTGGSFSSITTPGIYTVSNASDSPDSNYNDYSLIVLENTAGRLLQIAIPVLTYNTPQMQHGMVIYKRGVYQYRSPSVSWGNWSEYMDDILDKVYPIGSIYMSVNSTNPATLFGGTWVSWGTGRVAVGVDTSQTEFNTVEKTGGSATASYTPSGTVGNHTLTTSEIPSHKHSVSVSGGSHSHEVYVQHTSGSGSKITLGTSANNDGTVYGMPSGGSHTHTVSESSVGSSNGHNHTFTGTAASISALQPYITCYMWKRTA